MAAQPGTNAGWGFCAMSVHLLCGGWGALESRGKHAHASAQAWARHPALAYRFWRRGGWATPNRREAEATDAEIESTHRDGLNLRPETMGRGSAPAKERLMARLAPAQR